LKAVQKTGRWVIFFDKVKKQDVSLVGGKCASLGEMLSINLPVPMGFAITARAYDYFLNETGLQERIKKILKDVDHSDPDQVETISEQLRSLVENAKMPADLERDIKDAYAELGRKLNEVDPEVAVRSSATTEDSADASFAGQQETYLFVKGADSVVEHVKKCFSSLFTRRSILYRLEHGHDSLSTKISVGVQKMLESKVSGVAFSLDPGTGDPGVIVIECAWGVGESLVQGNVIPDRFVVKKSTLEIVDRKISTKRRMTVRDSTSTNGSFSREVAVPLEMQQKQSISDDQIIELAKLVLAVEKHYGRPMDIEWCVDSQTGKIFLVQARPETVWSKKAKVAEKALVLLQGRAASPGRVSGPARVILDVRDIGQFAEGDILVTKMTSPDWMPAIRKAAGIVTDEGGQTAHAAIVSRELGIPCVVGTEKATETLKTGQIVTVDGSLGVVFSGVVEPEEEAEKFTLPQVAELAPPTGTKIYMNLGEPAKIDEYKNLPFDGIGLMRIEFIIADWIGEHPLYMIENGQEQLFIDKLSEGISKVARAIYPRPVVVRFSDFKSNEYKSLKGGDKYERVEANPMLGWRGVSRYVSREYEPGFRLECRAIKKAREELGLHNIWVMIPFVRATWEVERALKIMDDEGLWRHKDFKVWIMAEVPSVVFLAEQFAKLCDGFSIGSNDLTQLMLGADRDSSLLANLGYFDERDPAVTAAISHLIKAAHKEGITVSICGQGPSVWPELTDFLIRAGIDSVSVNPDTIVKTRKLVASTEQKVILEHALKGSDCENLPRRL
jgi:pyruvate,water dikinase